MTLASLEAHIDELAKRKAGLDEMILAEEHRPIPDTTRVTEMKREKLKLKEHIEELKMQMH